MDNLGRLLHERASLAQIAVILPEEGAEHAYEAHAAIERAMLATPAATPESAAAGLRLALELLAECDCGERHFEERLIRQLIAGAIPFIVSQARID